MKIKKNLSDDEMLQGFTEKNSFETESYDNEIKTVSEHRLKQPKERKQELLLPPEAQDKLNQYLLEVSMEWFKNGNGDVVWKVQKDQEQIIIKPAPVKKKVVK